MKQSKKGMLMAALICGTIAPVLFNGTSVFAAENDAKAVDEALQAFELNPMVITAQRTETKDLDTPATTTVITKEDIKNKGISTVGEALTQTIGVESYSYSTDGDDIGGSYSRFNIRGLDKGTLVLVNGAPINVMNYASVTGIPVAAVEKIEIVKGSNSVLYGAEAIGGVVNIITKRGGKPETTISGTVGNYMKKYSVGTTTKDFTAYFERDYIGARDNTNKIYSAKREKDGAYVWHDKKGYKNNAYVSVNLAKNLTLDWSHVDSKRTRTRDAVDLGKKTGTYTYKGGAYQYVYRDIRDNLNLIYNNPDTMFRSILAFNSRKLDSDTLSLNSKTGVIKPGRSTNYMVYGLTFDNQKTWKFNNDKNSLTAGLTYKREHFKELENTDNSIGRNAYSVYASYAHQFAPKFKGILGVRGEFIPDNGWDGKHNVFLPQVQFLYKANDKWSLYSNVGKSFDMPAINSKYYSKKLENWHVKPQEGWTYEIGAKYATEKDSLKLALFHMDVKNKFRWVKESDLIPSGDKYTNVQINGEKFRNTGFEAEYVHKFNENWQYNVGLMIANPQMKDDDTWRQDSARVQGNIGVQFIKNKWKANLGLFVTAKREDSYYTNKGDTAKTNKAWDHSIKDQVLLNSTIQYSPDKNSDFTLTLNNILNNEYPINEYDNWGMPFNWMFTYSYKF